MKKYTSWPIPSYKESREKPSIPESFQIFGLSFIVSDNKPYIMTGTPKQEFNHDKIKSLLDDSYSLYKEIIQNIIKGKDISNEVTRLKDLHANINLYLSGCRLEEVDMIKNKERYNSIMNKIKIKKELDKIID